MHSYKLDEDILVKYLLFGFVYDGSLISQAFVFYPGLQRQLVTAHRPDADVDVIRVVSFKINPIADLSARVTLSMTTGAVVGTGGIIPVVMQVVDGLVSVGPHTRCILVGSSNAAVAVIHVNVGIAAA